MGTVDLSQTDFLGTISATFDAATQNQILAYLQSQGIYPGGSGLAAVQESVSPPIDAVSAPPPLNIPAQIAEFLSTSFTVDTGSNATIKAVIATSLNSTAILAGQRSVLLAAGNGNDALDDTSSGNDQLVAGAGNDSLYHLGSGNNSLFGGAGNDSEYTNSSGTDSLAGEAGNDTLNGAGSGTYTLDGGTGDDQINAQGSGVETGYGGVGNDTLTGTGSGTFLLDGGIGNNTLYGLGSGSELALWWRRQWQRHAIRVGHRHLCAGCERRNGRELIL